MSELKKCKPKNYLSTYIYQIQIMIFSSVGCKGNALNFLFIFLLLRDKKRRTSILSFYKQEVLWSENSNTFESVDEVWPQVISNENGNEMKIGVT